MIPAKISANKIKDYFVKIDDFRGGTNTLVSEARLEPKYAVESTNMMQVQDGVWSTKWGSDYYGEEISGVSDMDGAMEYVKLDGTREVIAVGGGFAWSSDDNCETWTQLTGATFTAGIIPFFLQIENRLYITNGVDDLAYYDGSSLQVFNAISAPTGQAGTRNTLTAGSYNNYYRIVAVNEIGYTTPSDAVSLSTNKQRDSWNGSTESLALTWNAVSGATGYDVYWGEFSGQENYITRVTTNSYTDDGSAEVNIYIETPDDNTTSAPKFRSMEISGNRLWATYDPDNAWRVYFSGTGQYINAFSPFYGGGYIDLEKGGRNRPVSVTHYRTGKGDPIITVLASSPDGQGAIFQVELTSLTLGDTTFTVPAAYKIVGSIGADAPHGVTKFGDNIAFLNKKSIYFLRSKEQIFNILSSDDMGSPIRNRYEGLNMTYIADFVSFYKPPYVFFSVTEGTNNDKVIIFDTERNNWTWAWNNGFKGFFEYTDTNNRTRFLAVPTSGNKLVEISKNIKGDLGAAFYQSYISPLIPVSTDYTDLAKVRDVVLEISSFRGSVTLEVLGLGRNKQVTSLASTSVTTSTGTTGWGGDLFSSFLFGDTDGIPTTFTERSTKIKLRVNKKLYAIQFKVSSNEYESAYTIMGIQAKGIVIPSRAPSQWS